MRHTIILPLFIYVNVSGQAVLSGKVFNAETGSTVPGATVFLPELHSGTVSDSTGYYSVEDIPGGSFTVQFSFIGFRTELHTIRFSGSPVSLDVRLEPTVVEAHEVIVSGGYLSSHEDNVVKIESIKISQLESTGSISLAEALAGLPGVDALTTGTAIGKPVIRGLSGSRVLMVLDGMRIENQQWGDEHGLSADMLGIEKVEIIKGPASLLYGSDAMGGVLNFIPEKPASSGTISGEIQQRLFTNTNGSESSVSMKGAGRRIHWGANGGYLEHDDFAFPPGKFLANSGFSSLEGNASADYHNDRGIFRVNYRIQQHIIGITDGITASSRPPRLIADPRQEVTDQFFSSQNTLFWNKTKLKFYIAYQQNTRHEFEAAEGMVLGMRLGTLQYGLRADTRLGEKIHSIIGVQGMQQENDNSGMEQIIPDSRIMDYSLFGVIRMESKEVTAQGGLRLDRRDLGTRESGIADSAGYFQKLSLSYTSVSGSLGGSYKITDKLLVRSNTAVGFRAPNLAEIASNGVHEGTNRYEKGSAALKSEQNMELDMSVHFHTGHLSAEVSVFMNVLDNYIYLSPTDSIAGNHPYYIYDQSDALLYGLEAGIDFHPHPADWLHFESVFSAVAAGRSGGEWLPFTPPSKAQQTVILQGKRGAYFKAVLRTYAAQPRVAEFETPSPGYSLADAGAGGKLKWGSQQISLAFMVRNLFNTAYISHLSHLKTLGIRDPGRNFVLLVNVPFMLKKQRSGGT